MSGVNFLEKLLDGVEIGWLPLGSVTNYEQPTKYLVHPEQFTFQAATRFSPLFA